MSEPRRPPRPISIWKPRLDPSGDAVFVRPEPSPLGDHFADAPILRPKRSELPLRVVLFGESVAAGYLYAPAVTPAKILAATLEAAAPGLTEVVDLARTNETLAGLVGTVEAAIQIQPDILVIWAGNNWNLLETPELSASAPSPPARRAFGELLSRSVAAVVAEGRRRIADRAEAAFDRIADIARAIGIPVVVVIPEVNLDGWENLQPPAGLEGATAMRWHRRLAEGRDALDREDAREAARYAHALLEIDGGLCPTGYRLLGRALEKLGRSEDAAAAFRAEVDAATYPTIANLGAPQATTQSAEILESAVNRHGWLRVDLRQRLAEASDSPIPDRRFFLDYCHHSSEGLRIAAAAIAREILPFLGETFEGIDRATLESHARALPISAETEATARLGAAIHGAHRLLPLSNKGEFLAPYLTEALALSPHAEQALGDLIEARTSPVPALLTPAQRRNLDSPCRLGLPHGWRWDFLDAALLEAARTVLAERGSSLTDILHRRILCRAIGPAWTELARPPWPWEPLELPFADLFDHEDLPRRAFLRYPWPESAFALISSGETDLEIRSVLRCPAASDRESTVRVSYRGSSGTLSALGEFAAGRSWRRSSLRLPRRLLERGLGRLILSWPPLESGSESSMAPRVERLRRGWEADLHPIFGEVSSLKVRTVPDGAAPPLGSTEGSA